MLQEIQSQKKRQQQRQAVQAAAYDLVEVILAYKCIQLLDEELVVVALGHIHFNIRGSNEKGSIAITFTLEN